MTTKRKRYWDYPSTTTIRDILGTDTEDEPEEDDEPEPDPRYALSDADVFEGVLRNIRMRFYRRGDEAIGHTMVGEPGFILITPWVPGERSSPPAKHIRLPVATIAQMEAMARAWQRGG